MDLWTQEGKERVGRRESGLDIPTPPYAKQLASGEMLYHTGSSAPRSLMT